MWEWSYFWWLLTSAELFGGETINSWKFYWRPLIHYIFFLSDQSKMNTLFTTLKLKFILSVKEHTFIM